MGKIDGTCNSPTGMTNVKRRKLYQLKAFAVTLNWVHKNYQTFEVIFRAIRIQDQKPVSDTCMELKLLLILSSHLVLI